MPFTATQRIEAYRFFSIAFAAAPGVTHLRDIELAYEGGAPTKQIVNEYTKKSQFKAVYSDTLTDSQFAINLVDNVVGTSATAGAKAEASLDVLLALRGGATRGDVVYQIFTNLAGLRGDAKWGALAAKLDKQVDVAKYYTETLAGSSDSLTTLRSALSGVDGSTDTSAAALNTRLSPLTGTSVVGKVIDGYIRGANVFVDFNGNGIVDSDTERATVTTTDATGGYSLVAPRAGGTITASGGINTDTGNANTLVLKAPGGEAGSSVNRSITPITTLITQIASSSLAVGAAPTAAQLAAAESTVKASLGLNAVTSSLLALDPVAVSNSPTASAADKAAALTVFKTGVQIAVLVKAAQAAATTDAAKLDVAASVITSLVLNITAAPAAAPVFIDLSKTETLTKIFSEAKATVSTAVIQNTAATAVQVATSTTTTSVASTQSAFEKAPTVPITVTPTTPTTTTPTTPTTSGGGGTTSDDRISDSVSGAKTATASNELFTLTNGVADTLSIPANNNGTFSIASTSPYTVTSFDLIRNFASGDTIRLIGFGGDPAGITSDINVVGTRNLFLLAGTANSAGTSFTSSSSGADLLMIYDKDGAGTGSVLGAIVFIGIASNAITGATGGTGGTGGTGVTGVVGG